MKNIELEINHADLPSGGRFYPTDLKSKIVAAAGEIRHTVMGFAAQKPIEHVVKNGQGRFAIPAFRGFIPSEAPEDVHVINGIIFWKFVDPSGIFIKYPCKTKRFFPGYQYSLDSLGGVWWHDNDDIYLVSADGQLSILLKPHDGIQIIGEDEMLRPEYFNEPGRKQTMRKRRARMK